MKKFFVATAIGYINAPPHIGHALEYVQADVLARYHRILGDRVFFLTGTDEHGSKAFETAKREGVTPKELADKNSRLFVNLDKTLEISYDFFIRTTDQKIHWPGVRLLWQKLTDSGDIYLGQYTGLYCIGCEAFLSEKELVGGKCSIHNRIPERLSEKNYFFRLSKYGSEIKKKIENGELKIVPASRQHEILNLIEAGLEDTSFSRPANKLPWGIPVPGDAKQIVYVWGDALTNYLTAVGFGRDEKNFAKFWPADVHVIGKDVLRFHAPLWPAMLISAKLALPKTILVHGFITSGGQKMSKSQGNVINPTEVAQKFGAESLRFYLLNQIRPTDDGDFTVSAFTQAYNGLLANGLGNLVARVAKLAERSGLEFNRPTAKTASGQLFRKNQIGKFLDEFKFDQAINFIWKKIAEADKVVDQQKPWELKNGKRVLQDLVERVREIASLLGPFLPNTSVAIQKQFTGPKIRSAEPLFPRI